MTPRAWGPNSCRPAHRQHRARTPRGGRSCPPHLRPSWGLGSDANPTRGCIHSRNSSTPTPTLAPSGKSIPVCRQRQTVRKGHAWRPYSRNSSERVFGKGVLSTFSPTLDPEQSLAQEAPVLGEVLKASHGPQPLRQPSHLQERDVRRMGRMEKTSKRSRRDTTASAGSGQEEEEERLGTQ